MGRSGGGVPDGAARQIRAFRESTTVWAGCSSPSRTRRLRKAEARKEFEEELQVNPSSAGAEFVLAELARQAENYPEAIDRFTRATKLDAMFADAFIGLGRSLLGAERAAEAVPPLEHAEKLQPDNPTVHFMLANAYRRSGRQADADREVEAHRTTSEKARQTTDDLKQAVTGAGNASAKPGGKLQ